MKPGLIDADVATNRLGNLESIKTRKHLGKYEAWNLGKGNTFYKPPICGFHVNFPNPYTLFARKWLVAVPWIRKRH